MGGGRDGATRGLGEGETRRGGNEKEGEDVKRKDRQGDKGTRRGGAGGPGETGCSGQALVEFALVLGVVVILAVGAVQSLYAFNLTRRVRAAAEEIADLAAVHGGDAQTVRDQVPSILDLHRLDADLADLEIDPPTVGYLDPFTLTLSYNLTVRFYGLFELSIPPQQVRRLGEGG